MLASALLLAGCGAASTTHRRLPLTPAGSFSSAPVACSGVSIYPSPGDRTATPSSQVSLQDLAAGLAQPATVTVVGSESGTHQGRWVADSSGHGASFYPSRPFTAGEKVTVKTDFSICGAKGDTAHFWVAEPAPTASGEASSAPTPPTPARDVQHFRSAPSLQPPVLEVTKADKSAEGDFLLAPKGGSRAGGPMIVNGSGQLVWFDPLPLGVNSSDLRVQQFEGQNVLTWWQGKIINGTGYGEDVIMNSRYQVLAVVHAANGLSADLHEFLLGPGGTAWITSYQSVGWDLRSVGGPKDAAVYDSVVQELDIATGNVLFRWSSLTHVSPKLSVISYDPSSTAPYDPFHVNSISPSGHGTVLISSRNTDAVYLVDEATGQTLWRLGGKESDFAMGPGTAFALQHDAELRGTSYLTVFDDEDRTGSGPPARALALRLNFRTGAASLVWARMAPGHPLVPYQGNVQLLGDGDVVTGWGSAPGSPTTEFDASGGVVFEAHFVPAAVNSYRAYRSPWAGAPLTPPALTVRASGEGISVYVSWNGATSVSRWRLLGGSSSDSLRPLTTVKMTGFETRLSYGHGVKVVAVQALGRSGQVLGQSAVVPA